MGHQLSSLSETNRLYEMPLHQYGLKERTNQALSTWKNKSPPHDQLIECRMVVNSQDELRNIYDIFKMRHLHMYLPSTKYLTCEQYGIKGCGQYYKGNIYMDSAVANLSLINDIPFIDSLHIYAVALKGFEILFHKFGYFDVFQDMFHICENGKLKVWCNSQLYKLSPEPYLLDINGRQQDMIYRILNIIDENIDRTDQYNMKQLLYRKIAPGTHYKQFEQINLVFRNICKENNWQPPERLKCISQLTKEDIHKLIVQQHCLQDQNQNAKESKGMLTINNLSTNDIVPPHKQHNQGNTSIRIPVSQTPIKTSQPTQTYIQTQSHSQRPDNNNTSLYNLLENSENNRVRYGTNNSLGHPQMNNISVSTIPPNNDIISRPPPRYLTARANTPQIRPRENIKIVENKPTVVKILSVQKNAPNRNINYIRHPHQNLYSIPPPLPVSPRLIQTTPQIVTPHMPSTAFVPKSPIMVHNSIQLSSSQKQFNIISLAGTGKFIQTPGTMQRKQSHEQLPTVKNNEQGQHENDKTKSSKAQSLKSSKHNKQSNQNLYSSSKKSNRSTQNNKNTQKQEQSKKQIKNPSYQTIDKKQVGFYSHEDEKVIKSIILPEYTMNSDKSSNRSQLNEKDRKNSGLGLDSYKYSITQSKKDGPSTFNFEERFQQSIEPRQNLSSKNKQSSSYFVKYSTAYEPSLSQKQSFNTNTNTPQQYTASQRVSSEQIAQYTDPKLLSMLSTYKNPTNIATNPTFNFNLNNQPNSFNSLNTNTNFSYLNKNSELNTNQLYYSFSSNKNRENKYNYGDLGMTDSNQVRQSSKIRQRQYQSEANIKYNSIKFQESDNSMISSQNQSKKYHNSIDKQIWKDLLELKKHKNLY